MGWKADWSTATPMLALGVIAFSWGDLLFGIDTAAFSALQVLPAWLNDFGDYSADREAQGLYPYFNPTSRTSIMNAIVFLGSFVGCAMFEPICERWGYKITIYIAALFQIVAVTVEITAVTSGSWIQFTAGRVIGYVGVGLVENASPGYCSEVSPAALRGFMSGSMTVLVTVGNVIGVGVAVPFVNEMRSLGWMVPVAIQFLPAIGIFAMVPFCPESPRWLISKDRDDEALRSLNRLRKGREVESGATQAELEAIRQEVEYVRSLEQGRWIDLFSAKYRLRTFIVTGLFFWYQTTGGQFANVYGPTFYRQLGFSTSVLFIYQTIGQSVGVIASIIGILLIDKIGRRPPVLFGACLLFVCNILIGSLGPLETKTAPQEGVIIASIMLLLSGLKLSFQLSSFLLASEIGGNRMRKKFMGFGTTVDVIFRFVFILVVPYLINAPLALGARFGYVMAVFAGVSIIFVVLLVPETMGRSLEEMDELFAMKLWPWQWRSAVTTGVGSRVAAVEHGDIERPAEKDVGEAQHAERVDTASINSGTGPRRA